MTRLAAIAMVCATGCAGGAPSPGAVAEADSIWTERCVRCHGEVGRGDGPNAVKLAEQPRDLTLRSWQLQTSDERIRQVVLSGGGVAGLSPLMPPNPDLEGKAEVLDALVQKVRSLEGR